MPFFDDIGDFIYGADKGINGQKRNKNDKQEDPVYLIFTAELVEPVDKDPVVKVAHHRGVAYRYERTQNGCDAD